MNGSPFCTAVMVQEHLHQCPKKAKGGNLSASPASPTAAFRAHLFIIHKLYDAGSPAFDGSSELHEDRRISAGALQEAAVLSQSLLHRVTRDLGKPSVCISAD